MLLAKKLESLLNGGGAAAGAAGLESEIKALRVEADGYRRELGEIPGKRAKAITGDNYAAIAEGLETRERELYRLLERADYQMTALEQRLEEIRAAELIPKLAKYQAEIDRNVEQLDKLLVQAVVVNAALEKLSKDALRELGSLAGKLPHTMFGGLVNEASLVMWRNNLADARRRIADSEKAATQPYRAPTIDEIFARAAAQPDERLRRYS